MIHDVVVVGGGISGLALARELASQGRASLILERSRGVGGRCATRRIEGQPVDHGLAYLHGRTPRFLAEVRRVPEVTDIPDWPRVRDGSGTACRPEAFGGNDQRVAFDEGVNRFAKHLALGLEVRLNAAVTALRPAEFASNGGRGWELTLASGGPVRARAVALTMTAPSVAEMLGHMTPLPAAIAATLPLLHLIRTLACLTVIARYPALGPVPEWQASYPRSSAAIQAIYHDSSKRTGAAHGMLVIQSRPGFSRAHLEDPPESWTRAMLEEAASLHGGWIARPDLVQSHVWRKARVDAGSELARPLAITLDGGEVLGIAGDGFHDAGGIEGAYLSGIDLATRLIEAMPR